MEEITAVETSLNQIQSKQQFTGTVIKVTLAGAFVDIGQSVPGFVHISQLQKEPVKRVEDVVQEGQEVEVWVKKVFPKKERVDLTMVKPLGLEWKEIEKEMVLKGTVSRIEKFGAFVEIGAERPGLVHISEMTHDYIKSVSDVVKEGDEVEVKVLDVDRKKKQIKLSMKALIEKPEKLVEDVIQSKVDRRGGRPQRENQPMAEAFSAEDHPEPVPTAMEMALRNAMDRVRDADAPLRSEKKRKGNNELENILERTLRNKAK